ncbi:hypothetical protein F0562_001629 [Nyssa sinensis]|uniref:Uncharacterized protein n=1 Tax=Nyssa sinensis TaxID=561372 RepID=A0A5J5C3K0_9ASTE|nr:hypothetical protein F0562_001629 [Nyssa sinensis]
MEGRFLKKGEILLVKGSPSNAEVNYGFLLFIPPSEPIIESTKEALTTTKRHIEGKTTFGLYLDPYKLLKILKLDKVHMFRFELDVGDHIFQNNQDPNVTIVFEANTDKEVSTSKDIHIDATETQNVQKGALEDAGSERDSTQIQFGDPSGSQVFEQDNIVVKDPILDAIKGSLPKVEITGEASTRVENTKFEGDKKFSIEFSCYFATRF